MPINTIRNTAARVINHTNDKWLNLSKSKIDLYSILISLSIALSFYVIHLFIFHGLLADSASPFVSDLIMTLSVSLVFLIFIKLLTKYAKSQKELQKTHDELTEAYEQLQVTSLKDSLTGLYRDRNFMIDEISRLYALAERSSETLVFFFMDLDKLKDINAVFSHVGGDHAIKATASVIRSIIRKEIIVFRFGGDEFFAAIRFEVNSELQKNIDSLVKRLKDAVDNTLCYSEGNLIPISITIGTKIVDLGNSIEMELEAVSNLMLEKK